MSEQGEKKAPAVRRIMAPAVNEETEAFWKAAEGGKLQTLPAQELDTKAKVPVSA